MCGIIGALLAPRSDYRIDTQRFQAALGAIAHRGPDGSGTLQEENLFLGHTRLSILDLSDAGSQPMNDQSGTHAIVYNGEVYNFKELAAAHGLQGLRSGSDTEVILELLARCGDDAHTLLSGMFSFAHLNRERQVLTLVRDRAGIKPLSFYRDARGFYFCSEPKGIIAMLESAPALDESKLSEWSYYGTALGEAALYRGMRQLLPGHRLVLDLQTGESKISQYWRPRAKAKRRVGWRDLASQTLNKLEAAVERQLVSDVPVGVFLSGGIDSSAIAALAAKHYSGTLSTYSVGFDFDRGVNELPLAKAFAKTLGTHHNELQVTAANLPPILEKMVKHHDSPFSDAANIPLFLLCNEVKDQIKVVLQGDGGDEVFGGYRRYATLAKLARMKGLAALGRVSSLLAPKTSALYRRRRYANALLAPNLAESMALLLTVEDRQYSPTRMFGEVLRKRIQGDDPFARYRRSQARFRGLPPAKQMLMVDFEIILPEIFLEKVDRSTMASSVEVRVPFLDNDLVEFCHGLSVGQLMPSGEQKGLLKRALRGTIPDWILDAPKKGFGVPYAYWLTGDLKDYFHEQIRLSDDRYPGFFNLETIAMNYKSHAKGDRDFGFFLWKSLNMAIWLNQSRPRWTQSENLDLRS